jgi:hypothetical protein
MGRGGSGMKQSVLRLAVVAILVLSVFRGCLAFDPNANVACLPFRGEMGELFAETVQTCLAESGAVRLVERLRLGDAIKELQLQDTAVVDTASAKKIGKLVGADYVLVGSSQRAPDGLIHVTCRLVTCDTGRNVPGVAAQCSAGASDWEQSVTAMAMDLLKRMRQPNQPVSICAAGMSICKDMGDDCRPKSARQGAGCSRRTESDYRVNPADGARMVYVPAGLSETSGMDGAAGGRIDGPSRGRTVYVHGYWIYSRSVTPDQYRRFCQATSRPMPPVCGTDDGRGVAVGVEDALAYAQWAGCRLPTEAEWRRAGCAGLADQQEWCADWHGSRYYLDIRPPAPGQDNCRIKRVGALPSNAGELAGLRLAR